MRPRRTGKSGSIIRLHWCRKSGLSVSCAHYTTRYIPKMPSVFDDGQIKVVQVSETSQTLSFQRPVVILDQSFTFQQIFPWGSLSDFHHALYSGNRWQTFFVLLGTVRGLCIVPTQPRTAPQTKHVSHSVYAGSVQYGDHEHG